MFKLTNRWIMIQAYKHNGELHRQWSHSYVIEDNDDYFICVSVRSYVIESDGRKWHTKEPALFVLSKKEWFNIIAMFKEDGVCYYVNIASPTIYDKGFLKYIDYDLDIKLFNDGSTKLLDVSEYRKHAVEQNYSDEIKEILSNSVDHVYEMIKNKEYPFDDEAMNNLYKKYLKIVQE